MGTPAPRTAARPPTSWPAVARTVVLLTAVTGMPTSADSPSPGTIRSASRPSAGSAPAAPNSADRTPR
ncbi:hypothetical protein [Streptomyces sp. NPDC086023]|uniref:hypothetical protein n=1 Tax=Streptomyces sp. NPDC086023 TaxID=3365746 RepID=UPI0037D89895